MAFVKEDVIGLEKAFALARLQLTNSNPEDKQGLYNFLMFENKIITEIHSLLPKEDVTELEAVKEEETEEAK